MTILRTRQGLVRLAALFALAIALTAAPRTASADFIFGLSGADPTILRVTTDAGVFDLTTAAIPLSASDYNQGWWSATSVNVDDNSNIFVGEFLPGEILNNFFTFDTSRVLGTTVLSAELRVNAYDVDTSLSAGPGVQYNLYDVSTDATTLNINGGVSATITADLGSGVNYGSIFVTLADAFTDLIIPLNASGIADLQVAFDADGFFSIGGTAHSGFITAQVPEPASLSIFGIGVLGLALAAKRRRV